MLPQFNIGESLVMIISIIILSLGFVGLFFGGKFVVNGLENIAKRFGLSHLIVGLTILSIGTSLPEIAVSIMGGIDKLYGVGQNIDGIVIGNKIGSYFIQITLILGILALSQQIFVSKWILKREGPMLFISLILFLIFAIDGLITRSESVIMIIIYVSYIVVIIKSERKLEKVEHELEFYEKEEIDQEFLEPIAAIIKTSSIKSDIIIFIFGLFILLFSAEITILSAVDIAEELHVPSNVIGVLIVSLGTSLPELSADLMAVRRKSQGIALGDIIGSNICDILLATSSGAVIAEFNVPIVLLLFDLPMLFIGVSFAYYFLWTEKILKKWEGGLLIGFYGIYVILKLLYFQI